MKVYKNLMGSDPIKNLLNLTGSDPIRIKICGLRRSEDIAAVNAVKPDFAGFIIDFPKSFRSVSADTVRELVKDLDKEITPVGVFVNASPDLVAGLLNEGTIGIAQLHGQEDEAYILELRRRTERPLIKAFSVRTAKDAETAIRSTADFILLDQGSGGTGQTFDWSLIPEMTRPFFLAGGLNEENICEAVKKIRPYAVDLSSSVETERFKDPEKIRRIVDLVRKCSKQI